MSARESFARAARGGSPRGAGRRSRALQRAVTARFVRRRAAHKAPRRARAERAGRGRDLPLRRGEMREEGPRVRHVGHRRADERLAAAGQRACVRVVPNGPRIPATQPPCLAPREGRAPDPSRPPVRERVYSRDMGRGNSRGGGAEIVLEPTGGCWSSAPPPLAGMEVRRGTARSAGGTE